MPVTFTQNKSKFSKILDLYIAQSDKLSPSEINDLNDLFGMGMELFEVRRTLPKSHTAGQQCAITNKTTVETPQRSIPATYAIMDLDRLITSHTPPTFKPDPRYPDKCQQRDYEGDKAEQEKVRIGALHFNPNIVINNAPTASDGAAIVNKKGFVLGGNGRTMMMKSLSGNKYQEYLSKLRCDIGIFGLSEQDIDKHKKPVLVRIVSMEVNECALFSNILNQNLTQELDLVTKTVSFARQLSPADISQIAKIFEDADSDTLATMLGDRKVVKKLQEVFRGAGIITPQNTSKWLKDGDVFTQEGRIATEGILVGTVLDDKDLIESARSFTEKIVRTIPLLLRMKRLPKKWNLIDDIQTVIRLEYERRQMGDTIDDFIAQISFAKPEVKEKEELIWRILSENSWLKWKNFLERYVKMGEDAVLSESSGGGFFNETLEPMDAIYRLSGKTNLNKTDIITDPATVNKIKNSIREGELIIQAGKSHNRKLNPGALEAIKKQVAKDRASIGLSDCYLCGYDDDKTRFESILDLYISNANKFTASEINELNEVFEMGKELFGSDRVLPVFEKKTETSPESKENKGRGSKYEDYGEKIGGAKKDIYQRLKNMNEATDDDIISMPLSKIFPAPDYVQLYDDKLLTINGCMILKFAYENIPRRPRSPNKYEADKWINQVRSIMQMFKDLIDKRIDADLYIKAFTTKRTEAGNEYKTHVGQEFTKRSKLWKELGFPLVDVNLGDYDIAEWDRQVALNPATNKHEHYRTQWNKETKNIDKIFIPESETKYYAIVFKNQIVKQYHTREEAIEALAMILLGEKATNANKKISFNIYLSNKGDKRIFIGKKMANNVVDVSVGVDLKTVSAARTYLNEKYDEILARFMSMKTEIEERRITNRPRIGKDWRNGKDITPEQFSKEFGFRGIEFGNWVPGRERQIHINSAYDALMDLSSITGLPPKAIALNGELALAFGARGAKGAAAHYERTKVVINLTRMQGSGTLAHEWFHALDNYFMRKNGKKNEFFTDHPHVYYTSSGKSTLVTEETIEAFRKLVFSVTTYKSPIHIRSKILDTMRSKPYWATTVEICARLFENYVVKSLENQGAVNDYLANFKTYEEWIEDFPAPENNYPYALDSEIDAVSALYQGIFNAIKTDKNPDKDVYNLSGYKNQPTHNLSDNMQIDSPNFPKIPLPAAAEIGAAIERAPQPQFERALKNAGVANVAIRALKANRIITPENQSAWISDSVTLTDNGRTMIKEGLWKVLFPHTLTSEFPDYVVDRILKNYRSFLELKKNGSLFLQFEIALELGKDWKADGRSFEEYCAATIFDNPLDGEEFAFLCPFLYDLNNDKFSWLLRKYVQWNGTTDRAAFLRSLGADIGEKTTRQAKYGLSDHYVWN